MVLIIQPPASVLQSDLLFTVLAINSSRTKHYVFTKRIGRIPSNETVSTSLDMVPTGGVYFAIGVGIGVPNLAEGSSNARQEVTVMYIQVA